MALGRVFRSIGLVGGDSPVLWRFVRVFGVDVLVKVSGLVLLPIYLLLMSQEEYATYSYLVSLIGVLALVLNFGLYVAQSKLFHDMGEHQRGTLIFTINVLLAALLLFVLVPTYWLGLDRWVIQRLFSENISYESFRSLIPAGAVIAVYSQMVLNFLLTREEIAYVQAYNLTRLVAGAGSTLGALYWLSGDHAGLRLGALLVAELFVLALFLAHYARSMLGRFDLPLALSSLRLGLPIMVSAILGIVVNFGDKYFVERYCSLADLSVYFLALTFSGVIQAVFMAFQNVWLPLFLKEKNLRENLANTRRVFIRLLLAFLLLSSAIWGAVAAALHVGLIAAAYADVLGILPILLLASVCASLVGLLSSYTVYWGMTYVTIVVGAIVAAVSVPLNYVAARDFGIHGIATVAVLINLLYGMAYLAFIRWQAATRREPNG